MSAEVKLTIDDRDVIARDGQTVLEAAAAVGIDIPNLCHDPRLKPVGACRMCIVEIEGERGLQTACTRGVKPGMIVRTTTDEIVAFRKAILELLLSEHRVSCTTCDKNGDCKLMEYAYRYGADEFRFGAYVPMAPEPNYTADNKSIAYDPQLCIRCGRCIRICDEVQGDQALTFRERAARVEVTTAFDMPLNDSTCELCGACVSTCPTGALYERPAMGQGQCKDMAKTRTTCPYCGVGCQIDLNVSPITGRIARATSEVGVIPNDGNLCVKGRFGLDFVHHPDRLRTPLIRENGELREATWDEALGLVADRLKAIKEEHGADAVAGLSSAKCTNEENYLFQKLMRGAVGTNNVDHCARLCHASTVAGLARAFGSGAMTNSMPELEDADCIFVTGSNTTEAHPVIGLMIKKAVRENGAKLVVADPRKIDLVRFAALHISQRGGTDVALFNTMMNVILTEGLADDAFIQSRTEGFDEFRAVIDKCTPEWGADVTGIPADDIRQAARIYARAERASIVYSMGITQHTTGTDNVLALANLAMITGNVGKRSTGVNPLRGQNNVQGACDLGALPNVFPGYQKVDDDALREKFEKGWGATLSGTPGLTVVEMIHAAEEGHVKALYVMGENPVLSDPNSNRTQAALEQLDLLVVQDLFLSETAQLADIVLPSACFAEKDGTFTNTERRVQRVRKAVDPPGDARPDWQILCDLGTRLGLAMSYPSPAEVQDEIAGLTPIYGGIRYDRIDGVGLQWPCPAADHPGTPFLHAERFTRGLGKFHPTPFREAAELPDDQYPMLLSTGRLLYHFHTGTMTRRSMSLDARVPAGTVQVNPADAARLGLANGDWARVRTRRGEIEVAAEVTDRMRLGMIFVAFHFREAAANLLTNDALDPIAKIPEFKVCAAAIEKVSGS